MADTKVRLGQLSYDKILPIEKRLGVPCTRWQEAIETRDDFRALELMAYILAAYHDKPVDEFLAWTPEALVTAVELEVAGDEDPTTPSEP